VSATRPKRRIWVLQLIFALAAPCVQAQPQATSPPKNVQIKLEEYGWQRLPPPTRHEAWPTEADLLRLDSKGRVLIGYPVREREELATRGNPTLALHVIRFTPEGKLDLSISLPTNSWSNNALYLDAEDHILVRANEALQMLTVDDQTPTQQRTWKVLAPCPSGMHGLQCRVGQPRTRRTLTVARCLSPDPVFPAHCFEFAETVFDTSSSEPQVVKTCTDGQKGGCYPRQELPELPLDVHVSAVLNDDLFVITAHKKRWEVGVVTGDGDTKFRLPLPKHDEPAANITYVKGDASGDRFAFVIDTWRGDNAFLDIGGHLAARRVVVYRSETGAQLTSLSVYPPVPHYGVALGIVPGFAIALSPDGHVLAVLSEGVLTIAKVD
jgi:hypothetical protein